LSDIAQLSRCSTNGAGDDRSAKALAVKASALEALTAT
jgi:hypothetical protein